MAIAIGDHVSIAAGGPPLTVMRILDDGTLECLRQIAETSASGEIIWIEQEAVLRPDEEAAPAKGSALRAETEPSGKNLPDGQSRARGPDPATIAARAYALWEAAGRPDGQHEAHWHQAERELAASQPGIETATSAGRSVSATARLTPAEAYDEKPTALPQDRTDGSDPDIQDEP